MRASREDDVKLFFRAANPRETKKQNPPPSTSSLRNPKLRQKSRILPSDGSTFKNLFVSHNLGTLIAYVHHPIQTLIIKFLVPQICVNFMHIPAGAKFGLTASFTNKWQAVPSRRKKTIFQAKHAS